MEGHHDPGQRHPEYHWRGEYVEVDRPNKLVLTMTDDPGDAREFFTVIFSAVDGGTQMRFSQSGGNLSLEQYERATTGWKMAFDELEPILAA